MIKIDNWINRRARNIAFNFLVGFVLVLAVAPLLFYGQDSIITVHDNLDQIVPYYKMLKENQLLLSLDQPTPAFLGMSTAFYSYSFNLFTILNSFFDVFTAHIVAFILKLAIGYSSMYLLLTYLFRQYDCQNICKLVALAFALLPSIPVWWVTVDSVPLLIYLFLKLMVNPKFDKKVFILFLYPFLSNLADTGVFLLFFWVLGLLIDCARHKKINPNLLAGFFLLCAGYLIVDLKLVYAVLFVNEPTNRVLMGKGTRLSLSKMLSAILLDLENAAYHGPTVAKSILLPVTAVGVILFILEACKKWVVRDKDEMDGSKSYRTAIGLPAWMVAIITLIIIVICSSFPTLNESKLKDVVALLLPPLGGFNWGRFNFLNRTFWPIAFMAVLVEVRRSSMGRNFTLIVAALQVVNVFCYRADTPFQSYNYSLLNLGHENYIKQGLVTYREFFDEALFNEIKADLQYAGEPVAAVGYHPSVLMYNGFHTLDGYVSMYPMAYHEQFGKIIAPELEKDKRRKNYFQNWGSRFYVFVNGKDYAPRRKKVDTSVELDIDLDAFREMKGRYLLSYFEISNADTLGLNYIKTYDSSGIYQIYVYDAGEL